MLGGGAKNLHQWDSQKFSHLSSKTAAGSGHEFSKYVRTHVLFDITHLPSLHPSQASSLRSHFTLQACIPTQKKGRMSQVGPLICGSSSACVSRVLDRAVRRQSGLQSSEQELCLKKETAQKRRFSCSLFSGEF